MAEIIHLATYRLSRRTGWSREMSHGYLRGNAYRVAQLTPPQTDLTASDDFSVGVQLGYRYGLHYLRWLKEAHGR
jgi:hypothetical protein